jgi:hypothetical protein
LKAEISLIFDISSIRPPGQPAAQNSSEIWKTTSTFCNGKTTSMFFKWKMTSFFSQMKDDLIVLENGRQLQSLEMEDNLNIEANGRRPQYIFKWKTT